MSSNDPHLQEHLSDEPRKGMTGQQPVPEHDCDGHTCWCKHFT